jgi:hypothetical protein
MDKQVSNKISFFIIAAILVLSGNYVFNNTLGSTFKLMGEYEELLALSESERDYSIDLQKVESKLNSIDKMIVGKELSAGQIQYQIMEQIESLRDSFAISISNVPSPHQYDYSKYTVITGSFELEGRYNEVLKLVHHLENNFENAILASLHFKLKKDMVKNKEKLYTTLYFQNIKKNG